MSAAAERFIDTLRERGAVVNVNGRRAMAQCPAHDDRNPSLCITPTEGSVLLHCFAGCETADVLAAVDLTMADLYDSPKGAEYPYSDGRRVHRTPDKDFWQTGNTRGRALYHAERLGDAQTVYICEGEKDVHAIEAAGGVAVCSAMGAGKAHLADWSPLTGRHAIIVADKDGPGRKHAAQIAVLLTSGIAATVQIVESAVGNDAADHIAAGKALEEFVPPSLGDGSSSGDGASGEPDDGNRFTVQTIADVTPERVSWLWRGRLPVGKLVVFDGDPGVGKSTLALSFAATVTIGGTWPDGTRCDYPGDVILLSAEDGLADTVRPRLDAAGADVTRVHAVQGVRVDKDGDALRMPTLADVSMLRRLVDETMARLVIVDVLMAYVPTGTDSHRDQDMRAVLARLSKLADDTGCTILLLRHLNKSGGSPLYRGGGSIGIVGAARVGMLAAPDPDDDSRRVLAMLKNNLSPAPESLKYQLVSDGDSASEFGVARVQWCGTSEHDARALLSEDGTGGDTTTDEAAAWLSDYLTQQGYCPSADAKRAGKRAGFSERTLQRAASKLKVVAESTGFPRRTYWSLPKTSDANTPRDGATGATDDDQLERRDPVGATEGVTEGIGATVAQSVAQSRLSRQAIEPGATNSAPGATDPLSCVWCGAPVVAGQRDAEGRPAHLKCQRTVGGPFQPNGMDR